MRIDTHVSQPGRSTPAPLHGPSMLAGDAQALADQIGELSAAGVEHLVLEFLTASAEELDEQLTVFAERVRPKLA
jgi:hypothetical protein